MTTESELLRGRIAGLLVAARERTHGLTGCLDDEDLTRQHSPLMSPLVWDLAHIANQEELWLLRNVGGREPMHPEIDPLYDAFEHPRAERPTLPLLPPAEARSYAREVRGRVTLGTSTEPWALDNERPAHQVHVPTFYLDTTPVSNAAYQDFIADGGYDEPRWWTTEGWDHRQRAGLSAPLYWRRDGAVWIRDRFGVIEPVPPAEPVLHVCWYEADAYARWAGRRLPSE